MSTVSTIQREEKPIVAYWRVLKWSQEKWNDFIQEEQLRRDKALPDLGPLAISRTWNITVIELAHLRLEAGFESKESDRKEALADRFMMCAEIAADYTLEKLQDPTLMYEADFTEVAKVARQMGDAAINQRNGTTASTAMTLNWDVIKGLVGLAKEMSQPFEPVEIKAKVIDA